jgi:predicted DNA-binding transcriptional regulator AlpA
LTDSLGDHTVYLSSTRVAARYAVTVRTIDRWVADPELAFPSPMRINSKRYWPICALEQWERARAAAHSAPK